MYKIQNFQANQNIEFLGDCALKERVRSSLIFMNGPVFPSGPLS